MKLHSIIYLSVFFLLTSCGNNEFAAGESPAKDTQGTLDGTSPYATDPSLNPSLNPFDPSTSIDPGVVDPTTGAITKGSFTIRTEPMDPQPLQDYDIIIGISLPSNVTSYTAQDLSGCVIGTDKYVYTINRGEYNYGLGGLFTGIGSIGSSGVTSSYPQNVSSCNDVIALPNDAYTNRFDPQFVVQGNRAEMRIRIPGGEDLVRDNIQVRSQLLNEQQSFDLVF